MPSAIQITQEKITGKIPAERLNTVLAISVKTFLAHLMLKVK